MVDAVLIIRVVTIITIIIVLIIMVAVMVTTFIISVGVVVIIVVVVAAVVIPLVVGMNAVKACKLLHGLLASLCLALLLQYSSITNAVNSLQRIPIEQDPYAYRVPMQIGHQFANVDP